MFRKLASLMGVPCPPDRHAQGPWSIHWADHTFNENGIILMDRYSDVMGWVRDARASFPHTIIYIASNNGYVYEVDATGAVYRSKGSHASTECQRTICPGCRCT